MLYISFPSISRKPPSRSTTFSGPVRMLLTARGASLRVKGKIYRECVQRVLVYGSETWPMKVNDMQRLVRTENSMVRWMSGVTLKDRRPSEELRLGLGIEGVEEVVMRGRLRWFGHVERKEADDWVSKCRNLEVVGSLKRGGRLKDMDAVCEKRHEGVWVKK